MNYYYLLASMPTLSFGNPPPMSPEAFRAQCELQLRHADYRELVHVMNREPEACTSAFAAEWFTFQNAVGLRIAAVREARLKLAHKTYDKQSVGYSSFIDRTIVDAFGKSNPRQRERRFDRTRFYMLEELELHDPFGLAAVLAAGLKLQILQRWSVLKREAGRSVLHAAVAAALPAEGESG